MADVKGGRGVTGISFSGKGNRLDRNMTTISKRLENPIGRRYFGAIGPVKPKMVPRTFVPSAVKPKPLVAAAPVVTAAPVKKAAPKVVSNVVRERPSPTPAKAAAPARKAVSARTGDTTGITTGKTTGTTARVGGVATKTKQTAYGRQMASAARRGNQPAGPTGGGGRSSTGGSSRPSGGGSLGGARGRIGEPGGSKR